MSHEEVIRRLEANLMTARRIAPPLGRIDLGEQVYVRRSVGEAMLAAELQGRKGVVFAKRSTISVELFAARAEAGPAGREELERLASAREGRLRNRLDEHAVLAVSSQEGWDEDAVRYARNDPPGTGYAHKSLHLVLIGPAPADVVMGVHDELARSLRPVFRGRTDEEEEAVAREGLQQQITLSGYAVLARVTGDGELEPGSVERAARRLASEDGALKLEKVRGAGLVLRRRG